MAFREPFFWIALVFVQSETFTTGVLNDKMFHKPINRIFRHTDFRKMRWKVYQFT